jgi:hypothetical protein
MHIRMYAARWSCENEKKSPLLMCACNELCCARAIWKPHKTGRLIGLSSNWPDETSYVRPLFNQQHKQKMRARPPPIKICFHPICVAPLLVWLVAQVSPTADTLSRSLNNGVLHATSTHCCRTRSPFPSWRAMTSSVPPRGPHRKIWMRLVHVIQCAGWLIYFSVMSPALYGRIDNSFAGDEYKILNVLSCARAECKCMRF